MGTVPPTDDLNFQCFVKQLDPNSGSSGPRICKTGFFNLPHYSSGALLLHERVHPSTE